MMELELYTGEVIELDDNTPESVVQKIMKRETSKAKQVDQDPQMTGDNTSFLGDFQESFKKQTARLPGVLQRTLLPPSMRPETFKDTPEYAQRLKDMSQQEFTEGLPGVRALRGVEAPAIAAYQYFGGKDADKEVRDMMVAKERGMALRGEDGMDVMGGIGQIIPATASTKVVGALLNAGKHKIAAGAGTGALIGAGTPTENLDDKSSQVAIGTALGASIPAGISAGKWTKGAFEDAHDLFSKEGENRLLRKYLTKITGERNIPKVQEELRAVKEMVPGSKPKADDALGQSKTGEGGPIIQHQKVTFEQPEGMSAQAWAQKVASHDARIKHLQTIGKDKATLAKAVKDRAKNAAPDLAETAASTAKVDVSRVNGLIKRIMKTHPARPEIISGMKRAQRSLFESNPLTARGKTHWKTVDDALKGTMGIKDRGALNELKLIMDRVKKGNIQADEALEQLKHIKGAQGVTAKSTALYRDAVQLIKQDNTKLRTNVNDLVSSRDAIRDMLNKVGDTGKPVHGLITRELVSIKKSIDHQIAKVVPSHKNYLKRWSEESKKIDQMRIGQALENKLEPPSGKESPTSFLNAADDIVKLSKKELGYKKNPLTTQQQKVVSAVVEDVERSVKAASPVQKTNLSGGKDVAEELRGKLPNILSRPLMLANYTLRSGASRIEPRIDTLATKLYKNPKQLADFLEQVPPSTRQLIADAVLKKMHIPAAIGASRQF